MDYRVTCRGGEERWAISLRLASDITHIQDFNQLKVGRILISDITHMQDFNQLTLILILQWHAKVCAPLVKSSITVNS